jgi:hypothetical protein
MGSLKLIDFIVYYCIDIDSNKLTMTILNRYHDYGVYLNPINIRKRPTRQLIDYLWNINSRRGNIFERIHMNDIKDFRPLIFSHKTNWEKRDNYIKSFETEYNEYEKLLPGHYEL